MSNESPTFDFSDYSDTYDAAQTEGPITARTQEPAVDLKDATDSTEVEVVKLGRTSGKKSGVEMPKVWMLGRLLNGKNSGKMAFNSWFIDRNDATNLRYAITDLMTIGVSKLDDPSVKLDALNDDANFQTAYGTRVAVKIEVTTSKKDATKKFGNMKIKSRLPKIEAKA